jgi:hypothetical protein
MRMPNALPVREGILLISSCGRERWQAGGERRAAAFWTTFLSSTHYSGVRCLASRHSRVHPRQCTPTQPILTTNRRHFSWWTPKRAMRTWGIFHISLTCGRGAVAAHHLGALRTAHRGTAVSLPSMPRHRHPYHRSRLTRIPAAPVDGDVDAAAESAPERAGHVLRATPPSSVPVVPVRAMHAA